MTLVGAVIAVRLWQQAPAYLSLERDRALAGELWRLWTGHLVHFGNNHLAWNLAVVAAASAWLERLLPTPTRLYYAAAPAAISLVLLAFEPALQLYAGLSGLAAGILTLLALTQIARLKRGDRRFWYGVLVVIALKVGFEYAVRSPVFARFDTSEVRTVPLAHATGVLCAAGLHYARLRRRSVQQK